MLSSQVPAIQAHLREVQHMGLGMLYNLLHSVGAALLASSAEGGLEALSVAVTALHTLRKVLSGMPTMPQTKELAAPAVVELLSGYAGLLSRRTHADACQAAAAAALDCLREMLVKPHAPGAAHAVLSGLLRTLCAACQAQLHRWQAGGEAARAAAADDPTLGPLLRLLVCFFETQLGRVEADEELCEGLSALMQTMGPLMTARKCVGHALVGLGFRV